MYGLIFGLFCLAFLLLYGMLYTIFFSRKIKRELKERNYFLRYARMLGLFGCLSLVLAIVLYYYGVG